MFDYCSTVISGVHLNSLNLNLIVGAINQKYIFRYKDNIKKLKNPIVFQQNIGVTLLHSNLF